MNLQLINKCIFVGVTILWEIWCFFGEEYCSPELMQNVKLWASRTEPSQVWKSWSAAARHTHADSKKPTLLAGEPRLGSETHLVAGSQKFIKIVLVLQPSAIARSALSGRGCSMQTACQDSPWTCSTLLLTPWPPACPPVAVLGSWLL